MFEVFFLRNLKIVIVGPSSQAPFVDISAQFTFTLSKIVSLIYLTWSYFLAKKMSKINLFTLSKALPGRFKQENSGILKTVKTCDQTHPELSSLQLNIPRSKKGKYTTKSLRCFKNVAPLTNDSEQPWTQLERMATTRNWRSFYVIRRLPSFRLLPKKDYSKTSWNSLPILSGSCQKMSFNGIRKRMVLNIIFLKFDSGAIKEWLPLYQSIKNSI